MASMSDSTTRVTDIWRSELDEQLVDGGNIGTIDEIGPDLLRIIRDHADDNLVPNEERRKKIAAYWTASYVWIDRWLRRYHLLELVHHQSLLTEWLATVVPREAKIEQFPEAKEIDLQLASKGAA